MDELAKFLIGLVRGIADAGKDMDAAQRAALADALRANAMRLEAIEPNLPRIHALGEARREAIAKAAREALALDEPARTDDDGA